MNEMCTSACEPSEPKSRIMAIYEYLQTLGIEVVELQRVVNLKRAEYFGIDAQVLEVGGKISGTIQDIEWMIGDIKRMVLDAMEYVENL